MPRFPWLVATGCVLAIGLASAQQLPPRDRKPAAAAEVPASAEVVEYDAVISKARTQAALNPADPEGYYRIAPSLRTSRGGASR